MNARTLPTCAKFHTVGPHVYMPTCPGWSGSKTSFVPVSVLWSLSTLFEESDRLRRDAGFLPERSQTFRGGGLDTDRTGLDSQPSRDVPLHISEKQMQSRLLCDHGGVDVDDSVACLLDRAPDHVEEVEAGPAFPFG